MTQKLSEKDRNFFSSLILDAAIEVHKNLGPGLLESVYEMCLCKELALRGASFKQQVPVPVWYKNEELSLHFRIDILVENQIVLELKAVEFLLPVHEAQLLTYLKLTNNRLGILINFNVPKLINGYKRMLNGYDY